MEATITLSAHEEQLSSLSVKTLRGNKPATIVLTSQRVCASMDYGIFGHEVTSIPIQAVDAIFYGWLRRGWILILGLAMEMAAIGGVLQNQGAVAGLTAFLGLVTLGVFWFYRPTVLRIQSGREAIEGRPRSRDEAQMFVSHVLDVIGAATTEDQSAQAA